MKSSTVVNDPSSTIGTRGLAWVALFAAWVGILLAFRGHVLLVVESWEKMPSHAHGYVVLLVAAYFVWQKRSFVAAVHFAPSAIGAGAFLLAAVAALLGELVSAAVVVQFSVVFLIIAATWAILGFEAFKVLYGPLAFLFFSISFGQDVLPVLMDWTADATVIALRASGIPVFQEDRHFVIPSGSWAVVEACSGIRYMFTAFFVGTIYAYITYLGWMKRVAFVLAIVALSLFANWLRAYIIVLVAHLTNNEWGLGLSHLTLGWVIFGMVVFIAFWLGNRWRDPDPVAPAAVSTQAAPAGMTMATGVVIILTAFAVPALAQSLLAGAGNRDGVPALDFARSLHGLAAIEPQHQMITPAFIGAVGIHRQVFRDEGAELLFQVAYYRDQAQGRELVSVGNQIEPTKDWRWTGWRKLFIEGAPLESITVEKYTRRSTVALATRIYWNGGFVTQSAMRSKLYQTLNLLGGRGDDGAAIIIAVSAFDEAQASRVLEAFIRTRLPAVLDDLEMARHTP